MLYFPQIDFKIIDLGMGKRVYTEKVVTDDILGTNGYHAPEVLLEDSYDFKADIFMLGITFCVLVSVVNTIDWGYRVGEGEGLFMSRPWF